MNSIKVRTDIGGYCGWSLFETTEHISWDDEAKKRSVINSYHIPTLFTTFEKEDILSKEIRYKFAKDDWRTIWFHDVAYIINSQGKTIETIYVN
jgi:hypothetical protein